MKKGEGRKLRAIWQEMNQRCVYYKDEGGDDDGQGSVVEIITW